MTNQDPPLISLCLIVGNVEEYIGRCLSSFASIADEIVVVRAIGNQVPDRTLEIARDQFGARTAEYLNRSRPRGLRFWRKRDEDPANWPHVDDFAAARQMSFDLATGRYAFWCDSDDILLEGADRIREHARAGEYASYVFPYLIQPLGVRIPRERLILRGSGRWKYPVHECFRYRIDPVAGCQDDRVVIAHRPFADKTGSNERNLRILRSIPDEEMNAGLLYHLHCELLGLGDVDGAVRYAERAIMRPDAGKAERYEMLMNLGRATVIPQQREALFQAAWQADPTRREALAVLAGNAMDFGRPDLALAYAGQMRGTPAPANPEWNHRRSFHGWIGDDVWEQALRANGDLAGAEQFRRHRFAQNGGSPQISLLHATRGRPQMAVNTRKFWLDFADHPERIEHIFAIDADDAASAPLSRFHHVQVTGGQGCVAAWNAAAIACLGQIIVQLSDDFLPFPGWDTAIAERIGDTTRPRVLAVSDGFRMDELLCLAIVTRAWLERDCFLFHPDFLGVYSDNWLTKCAYDRGEVIEAFDLLFEHRHPAKLGGPVDATYATQNSEERYRHGAAVFDRLSQGGDWSSVPGFFDYWLFYRSIAGRLQTGDVVAEVGVWLGRSLIFLAQECRRQGKRVRFLAVDTFVGESGQNAHVETVALHGGSLRAAFEANLERCGVRDMVEIVECDSVQAAWRVDSQSLAFCFIDAAHDYKSVCADIDAWAPKVRPGGLLAGHDIAHDEVARAVAEKLPNAQRVGPIWIQA